MSNSLEKLKIESFKDEKREESAADDFVVMFNPASYGMNYEIEWKEDEGSGSTGSKQTFQKIKSQSLSFDILIDGTGVTTGEKLDVDDTVHKFLTTCYNFNGEDHKSPYLRLSWGALIFDCVLGSAKVNYTLFDKSGLALRAKINASFKGQADDKKRAAANRKQSPDLTHTRVVKAGDTLQLLCKRIYGKPDHYMEVARVNNLDNFRSLEPGATLKFPPLDKTPVK